MTFIVIELGPVIHGEVNSWQTRKQKYLETKELKSNFKKEMKELSYKAKKVKYMKKHNLLEESVINPKDEHEEQDVYYDDEEELVDDVANAVVVEDEIVKRDENQGS